MLDVRGQGLEKWREVENIFVLTWIIYDLCNSEDKELMCYRGKTDMTRS